MKEALEMDARKNHRSLAGHIRALLELAVDRREQQAGEAR